jgi:hypothetical protein
MQQTLGQQQQPAHVHRPVAPSAACMQPHGCHPRACSTAVQSINQLNVFLARGGNQNRGSTLKSTVVGTQPDGQRLTSSTAIQQYSSRSHGCIAVLHCLVGASAAWQAPARLSPTCLQYSGTAVQLRWLLHSGLLFGGAFMWLKYGTAVQRYLSKVMQAYSTPVAMLQAAQYSLIAT